MKYLKKFESHSQYESYIATDYAKPNVSYCVQENEVHYNPIPETRLVAKFNVTNTSDPTKILNKASGFSEIEIDSVVQPKVVSGYTFDTLGEHEVKYTLKNGVSIVNLAFHSCHNLTSIMIPSNVTSIGNNAFYACSSLASIVVDGNNSIYDSRNNCNAIIETATNKLIKGSNTTIIPNGVTVINDSSFLQCTGLTSVIIPNSVTSIGEFAFASGTSLTSITIPNSVTSIGQGAFRNCTSLKRLNSNTDGVFIIPNDITSISNQTFYGCSGLTDVTIPSGVTNMGNYVFEWCGNITSITILATTAPTITEYTFADVKSYGTLYVPSGSDYSTWMQSAVYYLGLYHWTKVEQ